MDALWASTWFWAALFVLSSFFNFRAAFKLLIDWKGMATTCRFVEEAYERLDRLPAGMNQQARVKPIYETLPGWNASTAGKRSWADLPAQAIKYVRRIEELVGCPVALLSTSPEREDTILMQNPFET